MVQPAPSYLSLTDLVNKCSYFQMAEHDQTCQLHFDSRSNFVNSGRLYRGKKKGHVSNFLGYQLIWCSMISWAFWHLFYWNRPKNETVPSKKLNRMRGVCGGSWKWQFGPNILFYTILCWFWCCLVSFCGQRIHLWKFWENRTVRICKNGRLSPNWKRRALCV